MGKKTQKTKQRNKTKQEKKTQTKNSNQTKKAWKQRALMGCILYLFLLWTEVKCLENYCLLYRGLQ